MNRRLILITVLFLVIGINIVVIGLMKYGQKDKPVTIQTTNISDYVGQMEVSQVKSNFSVRLLVLKHCLESMADGDAKLAIEAANLAQTKGLRIKDIGNHYVNSEGQIRRVANTQELVWSQKFYIDQFKSFVKEQMRVNAESGDTLVIFTIGHGGGGGGLATLGQRREVMMALAEAAEENDQEVLWWQLSCHAAAKLPSISELNNKQQDLFSIVASSTADQLSPAYVEGHHMEKVFVAMAEDSEKIDPNRDETITAGELKGFMASEIGEVRGRLVFARSDDEPIFGLYGLANRIPIMDHNGVPQQFPKNYIPMPKRNR